MLIAPLSAHSLGKLANGLCDDLLSCVARAWDFARARENSVAKSEFRRKIRLIGERGSVLYPEGVCVSDARGPRDRAEQHAPKRFFKTGTPSKTYHRKR